MPLPSSGAKIGTVTVKFVGAANVDEQVVRANMQSREGTVFDQGLVDRDIRSLYKTGLFEYIEVKRETQPDGTVNLIVEVTPKYRVLAVRFEGNKRIKTRRLEREVKTKSGVALDERQVKEDSEKIYDYYERSGYSNASVTYSIDRDRTTGLGTVVFHIKEGNKIHISDIRFVGNKHISSRRLRGQMETSRWHWLYSWLTEGGRYKEDQFQDDLDKLRDYYRDQGYLDVDMPREKVILDYPSPSRLIITIQVSEGRQYHIGTISFSGNKLYSDRLLRLALKQKPGMIFSPSKLDKDVQTLEDFYGRDGHIEARVHLIRKPNIATGNIDIEYQIDEGDKFYVESIQIEGNTKTKSVVILRELALGPGDVFDMVRMKISKQRLENTRFFDDVNVTPESTNIPDRRNLRIAVKEARTGNLTFGAGYSSLQRASVFGEVSQSNFDLFNRHSLFQGAGQKFRIRLSVGELSSEAIISFEEPWLFQQPLALGFEAFRTSSDFNSSFYEEIDTGITVYLRKRLFEFVDAQLSYTFQTIDIANVDPSASLLIQSFAGTTKESKVGLQLVRDTRNKLINTTAGNRAEFDTTLATNLLGGNENYYAFEFRGAQYYPIFEAQGQVLSFIARAGTIDSYGNTSIVPYFDRFFLGGPYTLRGFDYREVGPKDINSEPVGGNTYGMTTVEYSVDVVNPVRFAIFYDAGFVNLGSYDFNPGNYNDDFGFGLRLFILGAPLSLDYGIPLTGDRTNKHGGQFNFSFGTRF
ncbi:MAG: outer membrane protein assembly factor BamA [Verrucomicrobiota bacterium]|nr:outer membrane protein assembly factor BamA [Verrucomicrobiota bacterium]